MLALKGTPRPMARWSRSRRRSCPALAAQRRRDDRDGGAGADGAQGGAGRQRGGPERAGGRPRDRGVPAEQIPPLHLAKGNYFSLAGRAPFSRLVYPMPAPGGLGVHLTFDLAGQARFGPDVEWVEAIGYDVDPPAPNSFRRRSGPIGRVCPTAPSSRPTPESGRRSPAPAGRRPILSSRRRPITASRGSSTCSASNPPA